MNNNTKLALIPFILLALVVTVSYAFFAINPSITEQELSVDAATISLEYTDCGSSNQSDCANISAELKPGDSVTKTFKVENTGSVATEYAIVFKELSNTFLHDELVYTLEDLTNSEVLVEETPVPYADETLTDELIANNISIGYSETKEYRLTITFKEITGNQNYNENATFSIKIGAKNVVITSSLPSEYQQIEYIKSDGTQYIDTGVPASSSLKTVCTIVPNDIGYVLGVTPDQDYQYYGINLHINLESVIFIESYLGTKNNYSTDYPKYYDSWQIGEKMTLTLNDNKRFYKNETLVADFNNLDITMSFDPTMSITIFALNGMYIDSLRIPMELYSFQMYDNDTLVRNFVPAYRKSDNVVGLYETVNDQFYTNDDEFGNDFVAGPAV